MADEPRVLTVDVFIDVEGPSAQVLSFGALGGPPQGQLVTPATKLTLKAKQIGQVFAIGFDDGLGATTPNFYLGATSAYGIHIVRPDPANPGKFLRLKKGHAEAQRMTGYMLMTGTGMALNNAGAAKWLKTSNISSPAAVTAQDSNRTVECPRRPIILGTNGPIAKTDNHETESNAPM